MQSNYGINIVRHKYIVEILKKMVNNQEKK